MSISQPIIPCYTLPCFVWVALNFSKPNPHGHYFKILAPWRLLLYPLSSVSPSWFFSQTLRSHHQGSRGFPTWKLSSKLPHTQKCTPAPLPSSVVGLLVLHSQRPLGKANNGLRSCAGKTHITSNARITDPWIHNYNKPCSGRCRWA